MRHLASASVHARRNDGLDILRATAILLVLVDHFGFPLSGGGPRTAIGFAWTGAVGVNIFFSLSGFLIGGLLLPLADEGLGRSAIGRFWVRRWLRTLPLYYVVLTFTCWYTGSFDARSYVFLQNFAFSRPQPLLVSWSLVLEEFFYLFYPLLMLLAASMAPRRLSGRRCVLAVGLALIVLCNVARWAISRWAVPLEWPSVNPFLRLDCCAYGVLAAYWITASGEPARRWVRRYAPALVGVSIVLIIIEGVVTVGLSRPAFMAAVRFDLWQQFWLTIDCMFVPAAAAIVVPAFALALPTVGGGIGAVTRWISITSYATYLVHSVVAAFLGPSLSSRMGKVAETGLVVAISLLLAGLLNLGVERPFLRLRDRLTARA
jgi:peptidoglycan/LPS O-acetylase OafA/YrhL